MNDDLRAAAGVVLGPASRLGLEGDAAPLVSMNASPEFTRHRNVSRQWRMASVSSQACTAEEDRTTDRATKNRVET